MLTPMPIEIVAEKITQNDTIPIVAPIGKGSQQSAGQELQVSSFSAVHIPSPHTNNVAIITISINQHYDY